MTHTDMSALKQKSAEDKLTKVVLSQLKLGQTCFSWMFLVDVLIDQMKVVLLISHISFMLIVLGFPTSEMSGALRRLEVKACPEWNEGCVAHWLVDGPEQSGPIW